MYAIRSYYDPGSRRTPGQPGRRPIDSIRIGSERVVADTDADRAGRCGRTLSAVTGATGVGQIEDGNLIMVTSALPGEGKSFTALNLAISMAMELDHIV